MKITKEDLRDWWANNTPVRYKGKIYRVGKMSYGDYFLEPKNYKGGERMPHSPQTRFFYLKDQHKQVYGVGEPLGV